MVTIRGPPRGRLGVLMPELSGTGAGAGMSGKGIDGDGEAGGLFSGDTGLEARGDCKGGGGVALGGWGGTSFGDTGGIRGEPRVPEFGLAGSPMIRALPG